MKVVPLVLICWRCLDEYRSAVRIEYDLRLNAHRCPSCGRAITDERVELALGGEPSAN